jgi:hypothetical protein
MIPRFKSISGFVTQQNVIDVLNIYNRAPGITPPQFIPVHKELVTMRTGYYVGMAAALDDSEIKELDIYIDEMMVS